MSGDLTGEREPSRAPLERRVLMLPPTSRDADAMSKVLDNAGIHSATYWDLPSLVEQIRDGAGALIFSEESLTTEAESIVAHVQAQPVWPDLPIIIVVRSAVESPH